MVAQLELIWPSGMPAPISGMLLAGIYLWRRGIPAKSVPEISVVGMPEMSVAGVPEMSVAGTPEMSVAGMPEVSVVGMPETGLLPARWLAVPDP
ncbi:hypothetical protein [Nocardia mexicana]|uniref:Uncharacterized protein n=1 Tax=Nocardia mexicana TaxID=279262 RepID=A0A370HAR9_9NOCA|nr:hypothetical protein [Nocardia mexicana]RDI53890.1 hypothetical protein DFR68_10210 [Nocardia mexicana]